MHRPLLLALAVLATGASTAYAHSPAPGAAHAADDRVVTALVLLGLGVAAGGGLVLLARLRRPAAHRLAAMAVAAGVVLALTVAAPHLVHHVLDADQGASCPVLQIACASDATSGGTEVAVLSAVVDAATACPGTSIAVALRPTIPVRAPPV